MTTTIDELIELLQNASIKCGVRLCGWEYLLGLSASQDGLKQMLECPKYLDFIVSYIEKDDEIKQALVFAHKCLINISAVEEGAVALVTAREDLVMHLLNRICDDKCKCIEETCYILSNLTTFCEIVKKTDLSSEPELLGKILSRFSSIEDDIRERYNFLSLFFANISGCPDKRRLLVTDEHFRSFVQCINPEQDPVRRLGIALTLRNFCSDTSCHNFLLKNEILPVLLLPLMGPEEYEEENMEKLPIECQYLDDSKIREPMPQIRRALVQALSLLCYTETGWTCLKEKGVYHVARELHMGEMDPLTKEAAETLIGFLLVLQYSALATNLEETLVTPSATEIMKDIPDFLLLK